MLWDLYFHPLIYSMGCATENNQYHPRDVYVFRMHSVRSLYDFKIQGAQEMFQELPHIYVEPDELKKAIQSTGMKNQKQMNK